MIRSCLAWLTVASLTYVALSQCELISLNCGSTAHQLVPSQQYDIRALILLTSLYPASCLELFSGSLAPASYEALIKIEEVNLSHQNLADEPASQNK